MILIATAKPQIAIQLNEMIRSDKHFIVGMKDHEDLRHQIHRCQPEVVLLDVQLGGNHFRAVESVPQIVMHTRSAPAVVLMIPRPSKEVEREAARWGCFDVVSLVPNLVSSCRNLCRAVESARVSRLSGAFRSPRPPEQPTVH